MFRNPFEFPNVQKFLPPSKSSKKKAVSLEITTHEICFWVCLTNNSQRWHSRSNLGPLAPRHWFWSLGVSGPSLTNVESVCPPPVVFRQTLNKNIGEKNTKLCCEGVFAIVECLQKNMAGTLMHAWRTSRGRSVCSCPLVHAKPFSFPATKPAWHGACGYVLFSVKKEMAKCYHWCLFTKEGQGIWSKNLTSRMEKMEKQKTTNWNLNKTHIHQKATTFSTRIFLGFLAGWGTAQYVLRNFMELRDRLQS